MTGIDYQNLNKEALDLDKTFDVDSLESSINHAYMDSRRKVDEKNTIMYDGKINPKKLAAIWIDNIAYHIAQRQFGMSAENLNKANSLKDANGTSVAEALVKAYVPGISLKTLEENIAEEGEAMGLKKAQSLAQEVAQSYDQTVLVHKIESELGDEPENIIGAMRALNAEYKLIFSDAKFEKSVKGKGLRELMQQYIRRIYEARNKVRQSQ